MKPQEILNAESNMSEKEEGMSIQRAQDYEAILANEKGEEMIKNLKNGMYDLEITTDLGGDYILRGKIGDSVINIPFLRNSRTTYTPLSSVATLDGERISENLAENILDKYVHIAKLQDKPHSFLGIFKPKGNYERNAKSVIANKKAKNIIK